MWWPLSVVIRVIQCGCFCALWCDVREKEDRECRELGKWWWVYSCLTFKECIMLRLERERERGLSGGIERGRLVERVGKSKRWRYG